MRVRAHAMFEYEIIVFSSENARKDLEIIYFRKNRCFASAFEKSDCFIYIGGEEAKLRLHLKNRILEDKPLKCESEQAAAGAMFDAFCKEVLRNTVFNYKRKIKRQFKREIITPDPEQYIDAKDAIIDTYETDHLYIEYEGGVYPLDNETLYQSMLTLPQPLLGVLLLKFWLGMKDAKIAGHFEVTTRTIRSWRSNAIAEIQRWYQKKEVELDNTSRK